MHPVYLLACQGSACSIQYHGSLTTSTYLATLLGVSHCHCRPVCQQQTPPLNAICTCQIPTPRSSISKQGKRPSKQAAATVAAPASALLPPPNAGPSSPGKAQSEELVSKLGTTQPVAVAVSGDAGQNTAAADGGHQSLASLSGPRNMVEMAGVHHHVCCSKAVRHQCIYSNVDCLRSKQPLVLETLAYLWHANVAHRSSEQKCSVLRSSAGVQHISLFITHVDTLPPGVACDAAAETSRSTEIGTCQVSTLTLVSRTRCLYTFNHSCGTVTGGAGSHGASPRPVLTFPTLPSLSATADRSGKVPASASAALVQRTSQDQPSATSSQQQLDQPLSLQQRDAPLLQINPARLSRSGSRILSSPRDLQSGTAVSQGPESVSEAALAAPASQSLGLLKGASISENVMMAGDNEASQSVPLASGRASLDGTNGIKKSVALFGIKPQQSGTSDLLAAVNAVVGGLSLRHTASLSGAAALSPIAEHSEVGPGGDSAASTSRQHQQEGFAAPAAATAAPDMFSGMSAAGFRRTRSNLRTGGSLTASVAADLPRAPSLSSNPAGQLSRQVSSRQQAMVYRQPSTNLVSGMTTHSHLFSQNSVQPIHVLVLRQQL